MKEPPKFYCSFCGKPDHKVTYLVAGPTVFICEVCSVLCVRIILAHAPTEIQHKIADEMTGVIQRVPGSTLSQPEPKSITVWKDGTHKLWAPLDAKNAENDAEWLCTIPGDVFDLPTPADRQT